MSTQTFTVKGTLPGLNEFTAALQCDRHVGAKLKRDTESRIAFYARTAKLKPCERPLIVRFVWVEANRRRDPDNVVAARKFVLDALQPQSRSHPQGLGIIKGDGHRHIAGFSDEFRFDATNPRVVVTLEEVYHT